MPHACLMQAGCSSCPKHDLISLQLSDLNEFKMKEEIESSIRSMGSIAQNRQKIAKIGRAGLSSKKVLKIVLIPILVRSTY